MNKEQREKKLARQSSKKKHRKNTLFRSLLKSKEEIHQHAV